MVCFGTCTYLWSVIRYVHIPYNRPRYVHRPYIFCFGMCMYLWTVLVHAHTYGLFEAGLNGLASNGVRAGTFKENLLNVLNIH